MSLTEKASGSCQQPQETPSGWSPSQALKSCHYRCQGTDQVPGLPSLNRHRESTPWAATAAVSSNRAVGSRWVRKTIQSLGVVRLKMAETIPWFLSLSYPFPPLQPLLEAGSLIAQSGLELRYVSEDDLDVLILLPPPSRRWS